MPIEIEKKTYVTISAEEFLSKLNDAEICEVICAVAEKYNKHFAKRNTMSHEFAKNLSENACRFLAEVVTHHYARQEK
jgi:hypothetical protein